MPYTNTFSGAVLFPGNVNYNLLNLNAAQTYVLQIPIDSNTLSNSGSLGTALIFARIMDINCTNASAVLQFPDLSQLGYGEQTTVTNYGTQTFQVKNSTGTNISSIAPGAAYVFYASAAVASGWYSFQLGAAVSAPNVASIVGTGIIDIGGLLVQNFPVTLSSTTPYTFIATDLAKLYSWTSGAGTWNLLASSSAGNGWYVGIKNNGSGTLSVAPNGADTINGVNTAQLYNPGDSSFMVADGAGGWEPVGFGNAANNLFQFQLINLAGLSGTYTLSPLNKIVYRFTGALAGNLQVVVPSTVQQYWIDNETTGGALTIGTSGQASPPAIVTANRNIFYCDGSNVFVAVTVSAVVDTGTATAISVALG